MTHLNAPCDNCGLTYEWGEPDETLPRWCHNCEFWDFDGDDTASSWYRIGDTVEFIGDGYSFPEYGQRGTIDGFDLASIPARPILGYTKVWDEITETAELYNEPGRFTAFIGFEWTSEPMPSCSRVEESFPSQATTQS